jgi:hypothetical protein
MPITVWISTERLHVFTTGGSRLKKCGRPADGQGSGRVGRHELQAHAVGEGVSEQVGGQFALGGEGQLQRQCGGDRLDRVVDALGGDPLPAYVQGRQ